MSCRYCSSNPDSIGSSPENIKWKVVRGDTCKLRVEFYENDEKTYKNISSWTFLASARNPVDDTVYELTVDTFNGYVDIVATSADTEDWGIAYSSIVAELDFDLQVTMPDNGTDVVWTPIVGTISVIGDVTRSGS